MRAGSRRHQRGFTLLMVVAAVFFVGLGLAALGPRWADQAQREREAELLRVGRLYAIAIQSYYESAPGALKQYPPDLQSLLLDTRFVGVRRHIRRLYPDPLDPSRPWGVLRSTDGGVKGVYSQDERSPFRQAPWSGPGLELPAAHRYSQWLFSPRIAP